MTLQKTQIVTFTHSETTLNVIKLEMVQNRFTIIYYSQHNIPPSISDDHKWDVTFYVDLSATSTPYRIQSMTSELQTILSRTLFSLVLK